MDRSEVDKYIAKLFKTNSNPKNERSSKNVPTKSSTNTAGTSNVRSTSAKSKKTTTNIPQKETLTHFKRTRNEANSSYNSVQLNNASDEDKVVCPKRNKPGKAVKRSKPTSTNDESDANATIFNHFDNCNGAIVSSTPKINPVVLLERHESELNMDELSPILNEVTLTNKSRKVTSSECPQDSEPTENEQTVLQTSQNNVENNLIDDSVVIIDEIPARNRCRNNNPIPLNDNTIITIPEDDDDSDVVIIDGPSTSSFVRRRTTKNSRKERTNKHKINNAKHPETPKTTNVTIEEEENDSQAEVTLEGLRTCPICLESFKNKEVCATICGHIFCKGCILAGIATNKKCPTCRTSLTKKKIHPLFI